MALLSYLVTNLNKQAKLQYFEKLSVDCNSKPFWKACKPYFFSTEDGIAEKFLLFQNKICCYFQLIEYKNSNIQENIMLIEKDKLLSKQKDVASTFNKRFGSITDSLNLFSWPKDVIKDVLKMSSMSSRNDTINSIIKKFACHPSTKVIKKKFKIKNAFSFNLVSTETIKIIINDLDIKKASSGEIPTYLFKKCDFILVTVTVCVNEALKTGSFPDSLKCANVRTIYKKDDPFDKKIYRPVSILLLLSKVYERVIYEQTSYYFEPFFNEILCGFRKTHSTQHALFKLLTSWKNSLDRGGFVGSILMDLPKAYDCLPHDLLLAKLQAYGFSKESIRLFLSYLTNHTQRIKIGSTFSHCTNILKGIPQGSTLGPLLFNIFINDLFFFSAKCEICNFSDDNSLYSCGMNLDNIFSNLMQDMDNVNEWFVYSSTKANPDKFKFIILGNTGSHTLKIRDITITSDSYVTLLGITIDSKLNFGEHINNIVKKACYKLYALRRLRKFLTLEKAKILACSMIEIQFAYYPLIWTFCSKTDAKS